MDQESLPREDFTIRFTGGGPWDGHEIKKEYTPQAFCFHKTVRGELVTREYVYRAHIDGKHIYFLDLPKGEEDVE